MLPRRLRELTIKDKVMSARFLLLSCGAAIGLLSGCASTPQGPVPASAEFIAAHSGRIGVVMSPLPKVDTSFPGAYCLLCLAAASMANSALTSHTHTLTAEEVAAYRGAIVEALRKKG